MTDWITPKEGQQQTRNNVFTEERFRNVYKYQELKKPSNFQILRQKLKISKNLILALLPVLEWIPKYDFKRDFLGDVLIAIVMTPILVQLEIAYADITGVPLVTGLYSSIFPTFIYFFMGTSRHIAIGMSGVTALMIGKSVANYSDDEYTPLQIATAVTFLSGVWFLLFSIFRIGSLCSFLSESFTSAFYVSAMIHILPSRIKTLIGIQYPEPPSIFNIFYHFYELITRIADINYVAFGMSVFVLITLPVFNRYVKPKFPNSKLLAVFDLLLITFTTTLTYTLNLHDRYDLEIVGDIPKGLPTIEVPPFEIFPKLLLDSLILSIIVIPLYLPLTKLLAKKHEYKINDHQELLAYGVVNTVTSLFSCPLTGNSLARSVLQDGFGGGSQFTNIFTAILVLGVLLFLGPILRYVPICALSSILVIHMIRKLKETLDIRQVYTRSKLDGAVWILTVSVSIIIDVNYGTIAGMIASVAAFLAPQQRTKIIALGRVPGTQIFLDKNHFQSAVTSERILILKIIGNVHFANSESLQNKILDRIDKSARFVILNLACVSYIDPTGVKSLLSLVYQLKKMENKPKLFLTNCLPGVYKKLTVCDFFETFEQDHVFATVNDAVQSSSQDQEIDITTITKF